MLPLIFTRFYPLAQLFYQLCQVGWTTAYQFRGQHGDIGSHPRRLDHILRLVNSTGKGEVSMNTPVEKHDPAQRQRKCGRLRVEGEGVLSPLRQYAWPRISFAAQLLRMMGRFASSTRRR
jgi:hypothetical protein